MMNNDFAKPKNVSALRASQREVLLQPWERGSSQAGPEIIRL